MYRIPALGGRNHARYLMRRIAATRRVESSGGAGSGRDARIAAPPAAPARAGRGGLGLPRHGADRRGAPLRWERPLRALSDRHQLLGIEVLDPRELELPAAGLVTFVDPETGRELEVQTNSAIGAAATTRTPRGRSATGSPRRCATPAPAHLQLRTDRDWINDVVRFVIARRKFAGPTDAQSAQGLR